MGIIVNSYHVELANDKLPYLVKEKGVRYHANNIRTPKEAATMMDSLYYLSNLSEEHAYIIAMTSACKPIGVFHIAQGSVNECVINIQGIFTRLLLCNAVAFIFIHNHPSGRIEPSNMDKLVTRNLTEASKIMGIQFYDSIIVGEKQYKSVLRGEQGTCDSISKLQKMMAQN